MDIKNKNIIITGASSGIGKQLSIDLAKQGANIILLSRKIKNLKIALKEVSKYSNLSSYYKCDISKEKEVNKIFKRIIKKYKHVDILINNAGFGIYKEFKDIKTKDIKDIFNTNYFGLIYCTKAILPTMLKRKSGMIVNIASVAGKSGYPGGSIYSASKFAVIGLSETMYYELKNKGIKILVVCPGAVETNFTKHPSYKKFNHKVRHKRIVSVDYVSKEIIKAIKKEKFEIIIPRFYKVVMMIKAIVPKFYMKMLERATR